MITFNKLWVYITKKGLKRTDLLEIVSPATLAKLGKNNTVNSETIGKLCDFLECQPGDIMENVTEKSLRENTEKVQNQMNVLLNLMENATGKSIREMMEETKDSIPELNKYLDENGKFDLLSKFDELESVKKISKKPNRKKTPEE